MALYLGSSKKSKLNLVVVHNNSELTKIKDNPIFIKDAISYEQNLDITLLSKNLCNPLTIVGENINVQNEKIFQKDVTKSATIDIPVAETGTYTLSYVTNGTRDFWLRNGQVSSGYISHLTVDKNTITFTLNTLKDGYLRLSCFGASDGSEPFILSNIQLEKNNSATDYTSCITDFSNIEVQKYGKNLFDINSVTGFYDIANNLRPKTTWSIQDGVLFNRIGYYSGLYKINSNISYLPKGQYTISFDLYIDSDDMAIKNMYIGLCIPDGNGSAIQIYKVIYFSEPYLKVWKRVYATITLNEDSQIDGVHIQGAGGASNYTKLNMYFKNIQIEASETPTEYEEFKCQKATSDKFGTVTGLSSNNPYINLFSNNAVEIELKYFRNLLLTLENQSALYENNMLNIAMSGGN